MYILDTDHLSLIQRDGREGKHIVNRLVAAEIEQLTVTVITYEEQIRGRLSVLAKAKTLEQQTLAYRGLHQLSLDYQSLTVMPFTQVAGLKYQQLRKLYPRLGNMDLEIAAIAMERKAVLLTRNISDFEKIEELEIENWSS